MAITTLRRSLPSTSFLLWLYLVGVGVAEYVTSVIHPLPGLLMHASLLVALCIYGGITVDEDQRRLALALTVAPLIRLLSLSLPLPYLPQIAWYPTVSIPLLMATWIIIRQTRLPGAEIGLRIGHPVLQLMLTGMGLGLGVLEYNILRPAPLVGEVTLQALWVPMLNLLIFTGFTEELIFRGVLQTLSLPLLGRSAILYVALLFGVLHIGYLSVTDVVFVSLVGLMFGYIVHWGRSIFGVTLSHGVTNIMLFLILPYSALNPSSLVAMLVPWIVGSGTMIAICAAVLLYWTARKSSAVSEYPMDDGGKVIRAMRREHGLTYSEFAQRTGMSVRELAMIEHGLHKHPAVRAQPLADELRDLIGQGNNPPSPHRDEP